MNLIARLGDPFFAPGQGKDVIRKHLRQKYEEYCRLKGEQPKEEAPPRKPVKRKTPPEDQIRELKRRVRVYACLFAVALVAAICLSIPFIRDIGKEKFQIGQNYSTVKPSTEPTVVSTDGE